MQMAKPLPTAREPEVWASKLPLTEQRIRSEQTTKQLTGKATKTYNSVLRRELKKLQKQTA